MIINIEYEWDGDMYFWDWDTNKIEAIDSIPTDQTSEGHITLDRITIIAMLVKEE